MDRVATLGLLGVTVLAVLLPIDVVRSEEVCPRYPLGVTSQITADGETFYSTGFVRPFGDDEESLIEARRDAQIAARFLLRRDKRVPLGSKGQLQGAVDEGSCISAGRFYSSVSINSKTAAQAIELAERLKNSLATSPVPQVQSYSWIDGGTAGSPHVIVEQGSEK